MVRDKEEEYASFPPYCLHQFVGEYLARERFGIENHLVLDAIKFHCTGKPHMPPLSKIVFSADKIEPTRGYDSSALIKKCKTNYYFGFLEVLKANREFIEKHGSGEDNPLTQACYRLYLRRE